MFTLEVILRQGAGPMPQTINVDGFLFFRNPEDGWRYTRDVDDITLQDANGEPRSDACVYGVAPVV